MNNNQNKLTKFWNELKRRKVVRVTIIYASTAFILLELMDILIDPLQLPPWVMTFFVVLLLVAFPIVVILAWVFDITPEGIEVTPPADQKAESHALPNSRRKVIILDVIIGILLVVVVILVWPKIFKGNSVTELEKSIAVMPLKNFSGDPSQDFMSDGLTDEIINHLYKIKSFDKVVSLSSVLTYKGSALQLPQIASELKVNYILEGSYKKIGDQIRVNAQLIEAKDDKHIWQNVYDKPYKEIISIQADIATNIADHVKAFLTSAEKQKIEKASTENMEAYVSLQKAIDLMYFDETTFGYFSDSLSSIINNAFDLIQKAIELDPSYSDAYAWAGYYYLATANYGGFNELSKVAWDALYYFEKAIEFDPDNGMAHYGIGELNDWFLWNYVRANNEFEKFINILPNNLQYNSQYAEFLIKMGQLEKAGELLRNGESNFYNQYRELRRRILAKNQTKVRESIEELLNLYKEGAYIWVGEAYLWLEKYDSAYFYLSQVTPDIDQEIGIPRFQACLALANYQTGHRTEAKSIITRLENVSKTTTAKSPEYFTGWYYSGIGEKDSAFFWLEKAYDNKSAEIPWLKMDPIFNSLKDDDRYWDLYKRTGFASYDEYMKNKEN